MQAQANANHIDPEQLSGYLADKAPGFGGDIIIDQLQVGQSNPTYLLTTPAAKYILRKKPAGDLLPSAHMIEREYQVMRALHNIIPVPNAIHLCEDVSVVGQSFYLMDYVDGRVLTDTSLLQAERHLRTPMYRELVKTLAQLHNVDHRSVGLENYGRPTGYLARQLERWSKQYAASRIEPNVDMDQIVPWLWENLPPTDETAIVHGDFRNYNVIFDKAGPQVLAVLDWELSTIGHPLADLAYFLLPYHLPPDDLRGFQGGDLTALGIPAEDDLKEIYCRETGRSDLPDLSFFLAFSLFRSAAILAGVFKRGHDGTASNPKAKEAGLRYRSAAASAWRLIQTRR